MEPDTPHRRHFVTVEPRGKPARQVHYRRAGAGPPVILLHKSPESSHEYERQLHVWAVDFTVFAIDTPGYGLSDPLPDDELGRGLGPFADNVAAVMDALGLQKVGLYGAHTGGMVALAFACRHPSRADAVVINGIVALTDDEKAGILGNYFDDFTPQHDGRHLTRIWHRVRDQLLFFPWYEKTLAARGRMRDTFDVPDAAALHPNLLDLLRTGVHERDGYSAAFSSNGATMVAHIQAPTVIMDDSGSILIGQLDRLPRPLPAHVTVEIHPTQAALEQRARAVLKERASAAGPEQIAPATIAGRPWCFYADTPKGQIFGRRSHGGSGRTVVFLHDIGRSSCQWRDLMAMLQDRRPTVAFDLPGHGETGDLCRPDLTAAGLADAIVAALAFLGVGEIDLIAAGGGAVIAFEVARRCAVASLVVVDAWVLPGGDRTALSGRLAPDLTPNRHGGHLAAAWYAARDAELFWPWFATTRANAVGRPAELALHSIHATACDLLKAHPWHGQIADAVLAIDAEALIADVTCPITFAAQQGSPQRSASERAAAAAPQGRFMTLSDDPSRRWAAIAAIVGT